MQDGLVPDALLHYLVPSLLVALMARLAYKRIYGFAERSAWDVVPFLRKIGLDEVKTLFNPESEKYFRLNFRPADFKILQWKRCYLGLQYARDLAHNARIVQEWARYERQKSRSTFDAEMKKTSLELMIAAAQCRICAFLVRARLHRWLIRMALFPFIAPPRFEALLPRGSLDMVRFYERAKAAADELSRGYGRDYRQRLAQAL